jgi:hypothetical protein
MGRVHPCCSEEKKVRKGLWSPEEDERLASHIARFGVSCWSSIPELAGDEHMHAFLTLLQICNAFTTETSLLIVVMDGIGRSE